MVQGNSSQIDAAVLSVRLLALLEKIPNRAGKKDVHQLRTSVRRLEVQLGETPRKVGKALKRVRRKAGKVRDVDVHLGLLEQPPDVSGQPKAEAADEWQKLRKALKSCRQAQLSKLREAISRSTSVLESKLPALAEQASGNEVTAEQAHQRTGQACQKFLQWTRTIPIDGDQFHQLRISTKNLRYSLEPLESFPESAEVAEKLKQVQDAIGYWHDWATLSELAVQVVSSRQVCAALQARTNREFRKAHRIAQSVRSWMSTPKQAAALAPSLHKIPPARAHGASTSARKTG